ncbi:hypothetical protein Ddye_012794 [Dipteronia dyeriana]|uniref:Uncharacterized protein n=1 Tax=Dipteronia dyeriana TaxID=168575 RepID=A0AAD9X4Z1_9ROSI|nr:hypothetical protein Ddye_012794 [Dipteronia dyeriana]
MEEKKKVMMINRVAIVSIMVLMVVFSSVPPAMSLSCSPKTKNRSGCKDCVADQMKYGCPACVPLLHCMARCLWGGTSRTKCIQKCDCNGIGGKPKLSDCKKCMSRCKCSCTVA